MGENVMGKTYAMLLKGVFSLASYKEKVSTYIYLQTILNIFLVVHPTFNFIPHVVMYVNDCSSLRDLFRQNVKTFPCSI